MIESPLLATTRTRLLSHPLYASLRTLDDVRVFMAHHVFAVWDFMSLLKALQHGLTGLTLPWRPVGDPTVRRFVNELVLGEESDVDPRGGSISHFELYLDAMREAGADVGPITRLIDALRGGASLDDAFAKAEAPPSAETFVRHTVRIIEDGPLHRVAAAFTLGREDVIPGMFVALVDELDRRHPGRLGLFRAYLERHIALDTDEHGPIARRMLAQTCADDPTKLDDAERVGVDVLRARLALWDGTLAAVRERPVSAR
ncbi:MAG: DUF3050 domain-containing protein [Planctomycetes bacterium]|nr:DUF3050 domain-containing protein [Planctomycetota bacterium]